MPEPLIVLNILLYPLFSYLGEWWSAIQCLIGTLVEQSALEWAPSLHGLLLPFLGLHYFASLCSGGESSYSPTACLWPPPARAHAPLCCSSADGSFASALYDSRTPGQAEAVSDAWSCCAPRGVQCDYGLVLAAWNPGLTHQPSGC